MERLKEAGLVNHFNKVYLLRFRKGVVANVYTEMAKYETIMDGSKNEVALVTFNDPVFLESLCLLLYCVSVATLCFFAEMLIMALRNLEAHVTASCVIVAYFK